MTRFLIYILWFVFGVELYLSQNLSPSYEVLIAMGALQIKDFSYASLLYAGFLHANFLHIIFNTLALSSVGRIVEWTIGQWSMLIIFLCGILGGSVFSLIFHMSEYTVSVGASSGIMALFTALFMIALSMKNTMLIKQCAFTIVFALVPIIPHIDYAGHLGGAIVGLILGSLINTKQNFKRIRIKY